MSKQLTLSATMCTLAMAFAAFAMALTPAGGDGGASPATTHGSLLRVLISA